MIGKCPRCGSTADFEEVDVSTGADMAAGQRRTVPGRHACRNPLCEHSGSASLLDWLRSVGVDPETVPMDGTESRPAWSTGRLSVSVYARDEHGKPYLDPARPNTLALERVIVEGVPEPTDPTVRRWLGLPGGQAPEHLATNAGGLMAALLRKYGEQTAPGLWRAVLTEAELTEVVDSRVTIQMDPGSGAVLLRYRES